VSISGDTLPVFDPAVRTNHSRAEIRSAEIDSDNAALAGHTWASLTLLKDEVA
jgi:hypothetical protein